MERAPGSGAARGDAPASVSQTAAAAVIAAGAVVRALTRHQTDATFLLASLGVLACALAALLPERRAPAWVRRRRRGVGVTLRLVVALLGGVCFPIPEPPTPACPVYLWLWLTNSGALAAFFCRPFHLTFPHIMHDAAVALSPQATCLACTLWAQAVGGLLAPAILLHPASGGEHEQQQQQEREQGGAQAGGGWMDLWRESPLVTLFFSSNVLWILLRTACVLHLPNPTTAAAE